MFLLKLKTNIAAGIISYENYESSNQSFNKNTSNNFRNKVKVQRVHIRLIMRIKYLIIQSILEVDVRTAVVKTIKFKIVMI